MHELTKTDLAARDRHCRALRETFTALEAATQRCNATVQAAYEQLLPHLDTYNATVQVAPTPLLPQADAYNAAVSAAQGWVDDMAGGMEAYQDERSARWHASPEGQAYEEWYDAYNEVMMDQVTIPEPAPLEMDEPEPVELPDHGPQDELLTDLPACPEA
jgi:hypothetical protein